MPEMKNSRINYIGDIPIDWRVSKYKYHCDSGMGNTITRVDLCDAGIPVYSATKENTIFGYVDKCNTILHKGDMVIGARGTIGYPKLIKDDVATCTQTTIFSQIKNNIIKKYLFYCFCAFQDEWNPQEGSGVPQLTIDNLNQGVLPYPQLDVQKSIVNFLDQKCSEIDSLSADIQSQIDVLEQYKQSVITEAVTVGLYQNVEMKDSEIEWISKIPKHWKSSRLGYESYIRARLGWKGLKAEEYVDEGYAFLSAFNIQGNKLVWYPLNFITKQRYDESPEIKLHIGDILIVKDGAGIGKTARIDELPVGKATTNSSLGVITPYKKLDYSYCSYFLQSAVFSNHILRLLNGMGVPHLTQEVLKNVKILLPPVDEQIEIAKYLDSKCNKIDKTLADKKAQLETLAEYKKSLIYEYVTGKKEVPKNEF